MHRKKQLTLLLVVLVVVLFLVARKPASGRPEGQLWFYNEITGQLFAASDLSIPPIKTTSGPGTGVRAWVFSCGDCANPDERFIGYLEKMQPTTKKFMNEEIAKTGASLGIGKLFDKYSSGILVRSPNKKKLGSPYQPCRPSHHRQFNKNCRLQQSNTMPPLITFNHDVTYCGSSVNCDTWRFSC